MDWSRYDIRKVDWNKVGKAAKEILISIGQGTFLLRLRVDKLFPYILVFFVLGCLNIWFNYETEQAALKVEKNKAKLETLKIYHSHMNGEPFKVEMVIRGYLSGHAWREYKAGKRTICGVEMPEGMVENQKFPEPIITPTTKAAEGHDEDISKEEIIAQGIVSREDYEQLEAYTRAIFQRGTEIAAKMGLILVDTKYEFGKKDGKIYLMDEIHTPDSSRYFYAEGYAERLAAGQKQKQLSKEFVREWLMANGFQGQEGQHVPEMTEDIVNGITDRYVELYENIVGEKFEKAEGTDILARIEKGVTECLANL